MVVTNTGESPVRKSRDKAMSSRTTPARSRPLRVIDLFIVFLLLLNEDRKFPIVEK